jgi:pimeloyl-ACP methyl ester carboxylesterase
MDRAAAADPPRAERARVVAGGRWLEYLWIGPGPEAAPTLVFLHDGLGCIDTWRDFPAALAAATGCGALVYSRGGYGGSDALPGPWPESFMHDAGWVELPEVVAALGVRDGFLVGHSDGGSISLIYAAGAAGRDGAESEAARAGAAGGRGWLRGMALEAPHIFVEPIALESIGKLPALFRQSELWQRLVRYHGANAENCFDSWVEIWLRPEFRSWRIDELLPRVRCPVLAIQGESDPYGTLAQLETLAASCTGPTETLLLPACGHTPHRQQREATLAAMTSFVRGRL